MDVLEPETRFGNPPRRVHAEQFPCVVVDEGEALHVRVAFPDDRVDAVDQIAEVPPRGLHVGRQTLALAQRFGQTLLALGEEVIGDRQSQTGE